MYTIRQSRGPVRTAAEAPASFPAADTNQYSASRWSNNFAQSRRAPNCAPSHAGFHPAGYKVYSNNILVGFSFPATKSSDVAVAGAISASSPRAAKSKEVISFNSSAKWKEYLQASKQSNKLVVIYFTATWCVPCRSMEPIIKEFPIKYTDIELVKIDVDELFNISREYGIQTMPTFLFMKNGKEIDKVAGARIEELQRKIEKYRA